MTDNARRSVTFNTLFTRDDDAPSRLLRSFDATSKKSFHESAIKSRDLAGRVPRFADITAHVLNDSQKRRRRCDFNSVDCRWRWEKRVK